MNWFIRLFRMRLRLIALQPTLWLLLVISVIFALLPIKDFARTGETRIPIAIVNQDPGPYSGILINSIRTMPGLTLVETTSLEQAKKQLSIGRYEGVLQINPGFSEAIVQQKFQNLLVVYVSPSSSAATYLTELFVGKALEILANEIIIEDYRDAHDQVLQPLTESDVQALRDEIVAAGKANELISLVVHQPELTRQSRPARTPEDTLKQSALIYCALVIIFLFMSSRWVIDQRQSGFGLRMRSLGITPTVAVLASGTAMAVFCSGLLIINLVVGAILLQVSGLLVLKILLLALLYFLAVVGLALLFSSLVQESVSLMLISPLAILINTLLGGMITPLPDWAVVWERISVILPGRMLNQALISGHYGGLILGTLVYFGLGVLVAGLVQSKAREEL
jgi:ABC-2 type transport system permease protein